jgi:hypothetical protein
VNMATWCKCKTAEKPAVKKRKRNNGLRFLFMLGLIRVDVFSVGVRFPSAE